MFIGVNTNVLEEKVGLSWYTKSPEIVYSLPAALKKMTKFYIENQEKRLDFGEKFTQMIKGQKSRIWTFHVDCTCCG